MTAGRPLARGDLVLVSFPFTDLSGQKVRPALIVARPSGDDFVVAFITSRDASLNARAEHQLEPTDPEFASTGLKAPSSLRLNKLATLHRGLVRRRLGRIGPRTARRWPAACATSSSSERGARADIRASRWLAGRTPIP